jgi:Lysyl oxidase
MTRRAPRLGMSAITFAIGLAIVAAGAALVPTATATRHRPDQLLPDLDVVTPQGPLIETRFINGRKHFKLGFISAAVNIGRGPVVVVGHRTSPSQPMVAEQIVSLAGGGTLTLHDVGRLHYVSYPSHQHFHYLGFMTYELRRASDYHLVRPDEKTGFCLGDRYPAPGKARLEAAPRKPVFTGFCAGHDPTALSVREGISVGYGDIYTQIREGQDVDLTGLPAGKYYLVHRVNPTRALRESDYANNSSSVLLQLTWPHGKNRPPHVAVLAACTNTDHCRSGYFYDKIP